MIEFILDIPYNKKHTNLLNYFVKKPIIITHLRKKNFEFIAWGDPILSDNFKTNFETSLNSSFIRDNIFGHHYYILLNRKNNSVLIGTSLFNILPLYYAHKTDRILFSENALRIGNYLNIKKVSQKFIIETILFNYPLLNNSILEGILLLPSNSEIRISNTEYSIQKHTRIESYYSIAPKPWKKSIDEISSIFLKTVAKYLPNNHYVHALTGGFDGRTLVAASEFYNKKFSCYSFGTNDSLDVKIPEIICSNANVPYTRIELNNQYINNYSLDCGHEFILNSSGAASFARAHYLFAAKELSKEYEYLITGNFGSEIFRAFHVPGVVFSKNLYTLFNSISASEAFRSIELSTEFETLKSLSFKQEWEAIKNDILKMPCFCSDFEHLSRNQKFYVFVFEEMFRKYFGAEMVNQYKYLKNRTPFLDIEFLKELLNTELAGVYSDFFEHNPIKRYKGQVLYAHIIKKAYPKFGEIITDKGYNPNNLIQPYGKVLIVKNYLKKKIKKKVGTNDPNCVHNSWLVNESFWRNSSVPQLIFNMENIEKGNRELMQRALSLSFFIEHNNLFISA